MPTVLGRRLRTKLTLLTCYTAFPAGARGRTARSYGVGRIDWACISGAGELSVGTSFCSNEEKTAEVKQIRRDYDQTPRYPHGLP